MPGFLPANPFGHWRRYTVACAAAVLLFSATVYSAQRSLVSVVSDPACPVTIARARVERSPDGVVVIYSVRNDSKQRVKQLVLTAAAVTWLGEVIKVRMAPVGQRIESGSTREYQAIFKDLDDPDAERFVVGVQAVQWAARRSEWRGTLTLTSGVALAAR